MIGTDGEQLGIMSSREAYKLAQEAELDLVKIAPTAKPPVCKIIDYGKYRYEMARKEKEAKKKQKTVELKEVRLSPNIDTNDLNTKINAAKKFISKGNKVKVTLRFRGREMAHVQNSRHILDDFAKEYGYSMTAEDFVNKGDRHVTHMPADKRKKDWMKFINSFVIEVAKELIDITHKYGKKAYVFYDDSWVGLEPYGERFKEFGFDGLIKCVFNGYEVRLCAGVPVETHEIRLHPYLFPVGLGGAPTFMEGGNPTLDAKKYWNNVRRALLRQPIQRIGLGGYLHLTEDFPDFQDYIEKISDEFRMMQEYHKSGSPYVIKPKIAVLHYWGHLRSWTLSGHFHETYMHDLIHVNEALAGLPVDVDFISFEDVKAGVLDKYDIVINAGRAGSAWSGGDAWKDEDVVSRLYRWVYEGGAFIGIDQPSAVEGFDSYYRMAPVLGVDEDTGAKVCHGKWQFKVEDSKGILPEGAAVPEKENRFLTDGKAKVLAAHDGNPDLTIHEFGKGCGVYMGGFSYTLENTRMLLNLLLAVGDKESEGMYLTDNKYTECAYYPGSRKLVVINNSDKEQKTSVKTEWGTKEFTIGAYDQVVMDL